jgi:hypothetical protein
MWEVGAIECTHKSHALYQQQRGPYRHNREKFSLSLQTPAISAAGTVGRPAERQFPCQARPRRPQSSQVRSVSQRSYCAPRTVPPPPPPPPLDGCVAMVEIEPGVALPVRSAKETQLAIRDGFYKSLVCLYCTSSIGCILDADFVICPDCLCVNAATSPNSAEPPRTSGGVGLGFRL